MEEPTASQVPTLPHGTPGNVQLVGQDWLSRQTAEGARLLLVSGEQERRLRDLQASLHSSQLQVTQLEYALMLAERPLWKKLLRRGAQSASRTPVG